MVGLIAAVIGTPTSPYVQKGLSLSYTHRQSIAYLI